MLKLILKMKEGIPIFIDKYGVSVNASKNQVYLKRFRSPYPSR